ncbi:MAG: hypothetical protein GY756_09655 [bacterium]|nr:hypothetical protein [bacterium]
MKKVLKILSIIIIVLLILIVAIYFTVTSSYFLKSYILPYVGNSMGADITVSQIEVSPLKSSIVIKDLINEKNNKLNIKVKKFDCLFNIFDLINNKITINRLDLDNTYISVKNSIKTKNVTVSDLPEVRSKTQKKSGGKTKLPILNINNINIKNFNITYKVTKTGTNNINITKINNLNIKIPYLKTSGKGLIQFFGNVLSSRNNNNLSGKIQGKLTAILNDKTFPNQLNLNSQLTLGNNVTLLEIIFQSHKVNNLIPFDIRGYVKKLPMEPLLQNFVQGTYRNSNGEINDITFDAKGPDIQSPDLFKTLSGNLNMKVSNLYIPAELLNNPIGRFILLPINIIADSGSYAKSSAQEGTKAFDILSNSAKSAKKIKTLEFKSGTADIVMNDGNINIKEFNFIGSSYSAVNDLNINGFISRNNDLNLKTKTQITGIYLPIQIEGTLNNPNPNYKRLIPALLDSNINNLLQHSKSGAKDLGSTLNKLGKDFISSLSKNDKNKNFNNK